MDLNIGAGQIGIIAAFGYLGASVEYLRADEMGEVLLLENHFGTVGSGLTLVPKGLLRLIRFPTTQIPLTLTVPVNAAEGNRARFYNDVGEVLKFSELDKDEQARIHDDPFSHRSTISVEITVLFEFRRSELRHFVTKISSFEELGEQLGLVIKSRVEGLFGKVTLATALEHKKILGELFDEEIRSIVSKPEERPWAIRINGTLIGPIGIDPRIMSANTNASVAFAEKLRIITLAEAESRRLALEGAGRGEALGSVSKYLESDAGKLAAAMEVTKSIYGGASKVVVAPGIAGTFASATEILSAMKQG